MNAVREIGAWLTAGLGLAVTLCLLLATLAYALKLGERAVVRVCNHYRFWRALCDFAQHRDHYAKWCETHPVKYGRRFWEVYTLRNTDDSPAFKVADPPPVA